MCGGKTRWQEYGGIAFGGQVRGDLSDKVYTRVKENRKDVEKNEKQG